MKPGSRLRGLAVALLAMALGMLVFAGVATAKLTGAYVKFQYCPYTNPEVIRCAHSLTTSGEVTLGNKTVPITKDVVLQGGFTDPAEEGPDAGFADFFEASNKETLSKSPQPVPGGLVGLVPPEGSPPLVKAALKFFLENELTGVDSTLELARPASEIKISEVHLAEGIGVALKLPVKVHLENPFLGENCYIGSSSTPIIWELTSGVTEPPAPNESISGKIGTVKFLEKGRILQLSENVLVDNAWEAPAASGCGGLLSLLVDPIIAAQLGSTKAGHNTAILESTVSSTTAFALKANDEANP